MANKKKPPTQLDRWDKDVLQTCRKMYPKSSAAEISRILYNTSAIKFEKEIREWNIVLEKKFGIKKKQKR